MKKLLHALFWTLLGGVYVMLFAKRTGEEVRKDIQKARKDGKSVGGVLFKEGMKIDMSALGELKKIISEEEVKELVEKGKDEFSKAVELAKQKGGEIADDTVSILNSLSKDLSKKANEIQKDIKSTVGQKIEKAKKKAKKITQKK